MDASRMIVPIGALVLVVFIIIGGFLILIDDSNSVGHNDFDYIDSKKVIEPTEKEAVLPEIKVKSDELIRNTPVPIKVGEVYKYRTMSQHTFTTRECEEALHPKGIKLDTKRCDEKNETRRIISETEFFVENINRVYGIDCYTVITKTTIKTHEDGTAEENMSNYEHEDRTYLLYDKDTGKIIQIEGGGKVFKEEIAEFMVSASGMKDVVPMLNQWMLALNENFRWKQEFDISGEKEGTNYRGPNIKSIMEYTVVSIEKVNNRESFKVEVESSTSIKNWDEDENYDKHETVTLWIDVEKRILVKREDRFENLLISETNLVSGL